jgi:site-specific DNA-methyltransferase (adenine-specific)
MNALELRDNAKQQLQEIEIRTIETGVDYLNKVKAIETWAKAEKKDAELQNIIAEQKLRTQRILGELLRVSDLMSRKKESSSLSDYGLNVKQSHEFQKIASLPEETFEKEIETAKEQTNRRIELKEYEKSQNLDNLAEIGKDKIVDIDFRLGDFEEVFKDIEDGSIDCIITDPPYPYEFIDCWSKLSRFSKRVLKPNGYCIAYSGHIHLPEVMNRMGEHLTYYWTFNLIHTGNTALVQGRNVFSGWKPILVYQNGFSKNKNLIDDCIQGTGTEKSHHIWQQATNELKHLIDGFTKPNDTIIEPFAGSGTTIIACLENNRNVLGAEIDEKTFNIAKQRIDEYNNSKK